MIKNMKLSIASPRPLRTGDPGIYSWPGVQPAPAAPPHSGNGSLHFTDARGSYEQLRFDRGFYLNAVFTRQGHLRSGDLHKCEQLNHIVFGRARLTQLTAAGWEVVTEHAGGAVITIPPHVPHLYDFLVCASAAPPSALAAGKCDQRGPSDGSQVNAGVARGHRAQEDTLLTETWRAADGSPCPFEAWLYLPFRRADQTTTTTIRIPTASCAAGAAPLTMRL